MNKLKTKEQEHITNPEDKTIVEQIYQIRNQLEQEITNETLQRIKEVKHFHFENANKVGKWLANKFKKEKGDKTILKLVEKDVVYTHQKDLIRITKQFYKNLFKEELGPKVKLEKIF